MVEVQGLVQTEVSGSGLDTGTVGTPEVRADLSSLLSDSLGGGGTDSTPETVNNPSTHKNTHGPRPLDAVVDRHSSATLSYLCRKDRGARLLPVPSTKEH